MSENRTQDGEITIRFDRKTRQSAETMLKQVQKAKYRVLFLEGNDIRMSHVALLVRRDLPLDIQYESFRDESIDGFPGRTKLYSRDAVVAKFYLPGDRVPLWIHLGIHHKSKLNEWATAREWDGRGETIRALQTYREAQMAWYYQQKFPGVGISIGGDFGATFASSSIIKENPKLSGIP